MSPCIYDPAICDRLIAEAREDEPRPLLMRAITIAVDEALGEVARQQGGIAMPTGSEARTHGILVGQDALRRALRMIMPDFADQLEAARREIKMLCDERDVARELLSSEPGRRSWTPSLRRSVN